MIWTPVSLDYDDFPPPPPGESHASVIVDGETIQYGWHPGQNVAVPVGTPGIAPAPVMVDGVTYTNPDDIRRIVGGGGPGTTTTPASAQDWIKQNWILVAGGVGLIGLVLVMRRGSRKRGGRRR